MIALIRRSAHRPLHTGAPVVFGCLPCLRCAVLLLFLGLPELHELLLHQAHLIEVIEAEHVHPPLPPLGLLLVLLRPEELGGHLLLSLQLLVEVFHGLVVAGAIRDGLDLLLLVILVFVLVYDDLGSIIKATCTQGRGLVG